MTRMIIFIIIISIVVGVFRYIVTQNAAANKKAAARGQAQFTPKAKPKNAGNVKPASKKQRDTWGDEADYFDH